MCMGKITKKPHVGRCNKNENIVDFHFKNMSFRAFFLCLRWQQSDIPIVVMIIQVCIPYQTSSWSWMLVCKNCLYYVWVITGVMFFKPQLTGMPTDPQLLVYFIFHVLPILNTLLPKNVVCKTQTTKLKFFDNSIAFF